MGIGPNDSSEQGSVRSERERHGWRFRSEGRCDRCLSSGGRKRLRLPLPSVWWDLIGLDTEIPAADVFLADVAVSTLSW